MSISHTINCEYGTYDYLVPELRHIFHDMVYDWVTMVPRRRSEKRLRTRRNLFRIDLYRRSKEREKTQGLQKIRNKEKRPKQEEQIQQPPERKRREFQHRKEKRKKISNKEKRPKTRRTNSVKSPTPKREEGEKEKKTVQPQKKKEKKA